MMTKLDLFSAERHAVKGITMHNQEPYLKIVKKLGVEVFVVVKTNIILIYRIWVLIIFFLICLLIKNLI